MSEILLIRHGSKTDFGLYDAYVNAGYSEAEALNFAVYDVTEQAPWSPAPEGQTGISLAQFGFEGLWRVGNIIEPFSTVSGQQQPIDYYSLPLADGVKAFDDPHVPANGEV